MSTPEQVRLRVFDTTLRLTSDASSVIDYARGLYGRFVLPDAADAAPLGATVDCVVRAVDGDGVGGVTVVIDGHSLVLPRTPFWECEVCDRAVNAVWQAVRSHLLLHASAVTLGDKGVMLVGHSHFGKTTLALELVRRGWRFLSDDVGALGREDRRLYPFVRSVRLWPDAVRERLGVDRPLEGLFWAGKYVLDVEELYPGCVGDAVPLTHVVLLRDAREPLDLERDAPGEPVDVLLARPSAAIEAYLRSVALSPVREYALGTKPVLRMRATNRVQLATALQARCAEEGVELLWVGRRLDVAPSFRGPARLRPISRVQAARGMLQHLRGRPDAGDPTARATRLFLDLAQAVAETACLELTLGPLAEMADLLLDGVGAP